MIAIIIGLLFCIVLAGAIVAVVAIPARREGRDLLTARGEDLLASVRDRTEAVVDKVTPDSASSDATDPVATEPDSVRSLQTASDLAADTRA